MPAASTMAPSLVGDTRPGPYTVTAAPPSVSCTDSPAATVMVALGAFAAGLAAGTVPVAFAAVGTAATTEPDAVAAAGLAAGAVPVAFAAAGPAATPAPEVFAAVGTAATTAPDAFAAAGPAATPAPEVFAAAGP